MDAPAQNSPFQGLSSAQVAQRLRKFGKNEPESTKHNPVLDSLKNIVTEPMFLLLAVATILYYFLGDFTETMMMVVSILFVAGIELYQETKSERALEALRRFTRAQVRTLRDGEWLEIPSELLVPDDIVHLTEGERVPADGYLLEQHDLSADESVLTGESLPVDKTVAPPGSDLSSTSHRLFQGSTIATGKGIFRVDATGVNTEFGKLGKSIESIGAEQTPLQIQIRRFVRNMSILGGVAFFIVFALNFSLEHDIWKALLFSLTLAMAILPEEIPVAFSAFMGLGAFRMIKHNILAKQPKTVESLGSATVICLDKTGTITQNQMSVAEVLDFAGKGLTLEYALWASEPEPFDPMEKAILQKQMEATGHSFDPRSGFEMIHEYPLSGQPPMMTHLWERSGKARKIACKGAVERILEVCKVENRDQIIEQTERMAGKGYRVLGVAASAMEGTNFPKAQDDFPWEFQGLIAFFDPPKENIPQVLEKFYQAGLRVMMITGDHIATAQNIAQCIGLNGHGKILSGAAVMDMPETQLRQAVREVNVFARMFPDAKLRIVNALKANGEVVAMSGDGVNDGPALKAAHIGIAMGKAGTEIAKSAASLVLLKDDLKDMVTAVKMGRKIYDNLRKAIRYIISIHLPIVLVVLAPLLLGWPYPHMLLPLHVIFLELVMDPTVAIAFENEPAEPRLMGRPPRPANTSLFSWKEMGFSLLQGSVITLEILAIYWLALQQGKSEEGVRSAVFATMVFSNLFLTLTNRSFHYAYHRTLQYKNRVLPAILGISTAMLLAILYLPFLGRLFKMSPLTLPELGACLLAAFLGVAWFELYKALKEWRSSKSQE